jgi:hypothetical protein
MHTTTLRINPAARTTRARQTLVPISPAEGWKNILGLVVIDAQNAWEDDEYAPVYNRRRGHDDDEADKDTLKGENETI